MRVLVTGAAGFIGFHTCRWLLDRGHEVVGLDNLDPYYDLNLKYGRLGELGFPREGLSGRPPLPSGKHPHLRFTLLDITHREALEALFAAERFDTVCHLAAQAGVRHSLKAPHKYIHYNVVGFMNLLEACRHNRIGHLLYASSSSVYGLNRRVPFSTRRSADHPISIYGATKRSNELMAHAYSHLYGLPTTGLRFFTVYGPWGRPDMALFTFTKAILAGEPIEVYNQGRMVRDFTYITDIVEGIGRAAQRPPHPLTRWNPKRPRPDASSAPFRIYNIGNNRPVKLLRFIHVLEDELGRKADIRFQPLQPGDVPVTQADVRELETDTGFRPGTPVQTGIREFVRWYKSFYHAP